MEFEVRPIGAEETRMLRRLILRPFQQPHELVYPGDLDLQSLHVGAFVGGELMGVASVVPNLMPGDNRETAWQLRGMAARPEARRMGLGTAMLRACLRHVACGGGTLLWCNARTHAVPFYRRLGFETKGEEFQVPQSGPHFVMWRVVRPENGTPGGDR
jgi:ribosomal protein S18 acetylase RimI-like enzyme